MQIQENTHSKNRKRNNIVAVLLIAVLAVHLIIQVIVYFKKDVEPAFPLREVESIESFELLWHSELKAERASVGLCTGNDYWVFMQLDEIHNQVILPVSGRKYLIATNVYLAGFDLDTGQNRWRTPLKTGLFSIAGNSSNIFIVKRGPDPPQVLCDPDLHYCEAVKILSYDIDTGEEVWSTSQSNMNSAGTLCVNDAVVSIVGNATRSNYQEKVSLNAATGERISFKDLPSNNASSDFESARLILKELGIDPSDLWGRYALEGKYLYFLTSQDKTLWVVNRETPKIMGKVEFSGEPFAGGNFYNQFAIASVNDYVVVYLGDSQQLFAFRYLLNE